MVKRVGTIVVCIFVGVGIFAFSEALSQHRSNQALTWQIENTLKPRLAQLEKETIQLKEEKSRLSDDLDDAKNKIGALQEENATIEETLSKKKEEFAALQKSYSEKERAFQDISEQMGELQGENAILKDKITAMFLELKELRESLSSVEELRERIRSLRGEVKKKDKFSSRSDLGQRELTSAGNKGYMMRGGKSTYTPKVTIRVTPIEG